MPSFVPALFLVAHGLIHASFLGPAPAPKPGAPTWPFTLDRSPLLAALRLPVAGVRAIGIGLVAIVVVAFLLAGGAAIGLLPVGWFGGVVVVGAIASLALLGLFFHPWLLFGLVIDAALLWAVVGAAWSPGAGS